MLHRGQKIPVRFLGLIFLDGHHAGQIKGFGVFRIKLQGVLEFQTGLDKIPLFVESLAFLQIPRFFFLVAGAAAEQHGAAQKHADRPFGKCHGQHGNSLFVCLR
jgi:hypothetical protein